MPDAASWSCCYKSSQGTWYGHSMLLAESLEFLLRSLEFPSVTYVAATSPDTVFDSELKREKSAKVGWVLRRLIPDAAPSIIDYGSWTCTISITPCLMICVPLC